MHWHHAISVLRQKNEAHCTQGTDFTHICSKLMLVSPCAHISCLYFKLLVKLQWYALAHIGGVTFCSMTSYRSIELTRVLLLHVFSMSIIYYVSYLVSKVRVMKFYMIHLALYRQVSPFLWLRKKKKKENEELRLYSLFQIINQEKLSWLYLYDIRTECVYWMLTTNWTTLSLFVHKFAL